MNQKHSSEVAAFLASLRKGIWILCIPAWLFGALERGATVFSDHTTTPLELLQILTAIFFLVGWLLLRPKNFTQPLTQAE